MTKYISILRGINVGGKRKVLMADLKGLYEKLGFSNITTYIQSGNVVFDAKTNGKAHAQKIADAITQEYGFDVPVIVRTLDEWKTAIENNPYLKEKGMDTSRLHLTFLAETPSLEALASIKDIAYPGDRFEVIGKDAFVCVADRYSDSKLSNTFFEKKLKVSATTRNWKTVNKLYEIAVAK